MINTFLFDLDGTLLPMDMEIFEKKYFEKLAGKLKDYFEPDKLIKCIWKSTIAMVKNTGGELTNKEVFLRDFIALSGENIEKLNSLFDDFYINEFKEIGPLFPGEPYIARTIDLLKERGYDVVVATNPIFPMDAIKERLHWAGLDIDDFKYITSYENMHYCKPNVEYYSEVLKIIDRQPEECIMVGNDVEEDLVASEIGIRTFLIEDFMINRGRRTPEAEFKGTYSELYDFINCNYRALSSAAQCPAENVI